MSAPFAPRVGGTLSADIAVPEHARELQFYSRVLTTGDKPLWRDDLMNNHGTPIIGLGERKPEYEELPLQWMPHIQVKDVAASVARALAHEARELMHGKDEHGNSQWAVLRDPNGAAFGIIPVVSAAQVPPQLASAGVGCIAWLDLTVADASATRDFYREVIGWTAEDVAMQHEDERYADFNMLGGDGDAAAGICHARGPNQSMPPVWMIYLPVGDIEESLRRVEQGGGKVLHASRGSDGSCATAVIEDPVGVHFAIAAG